MAPLGGCGMNFIAELTL